MDGKSQIIFSRFSAPTQFIHKMSAMLDFQQRASPIVSIVKGPAFISNDEPAYTDILSRHLAAGARNKRKLVFSKQKMTWTEISGF